MTYLVDANVLSEATKPKPDPTVLAWLRREERQLAIDPIILGEIRYGILLLPKGRRRQRLETWFAAGILRLTCLAWDADTGMGWARLLARMKTQGQSMPIKDSLIAATALRHDLTVATRNVRDFTPAKVRTVNPFALGSERRS